MDKPTFQHVEIFVPRRKRLSEVRVDGIPIRGLVDYSVDFSQESPVVTLMFRPETIRVHGEMEVRHASAH